MKKGGQVPPLPPSGYAPDPATCKCLLSPVSHTVCPRSYSIASAVTAVHRDCLLLVSNAVFSLKRGTMRPATLCSRVCRTSACANRDNARQWEWRYCGIMNRNLLKLPRGFSTSHVMVQRKALIGALHLLYWLAKEEVTHTNKFNSLKEVAILLGCDYLRELNLGRNAQYF